MSFVRTYIAKLKAVRSQRQKKVRLKKYIRNNRLPWTEGYEDYKWMKISESIHDAAFLQNIKSGNQLPAGYGVGLDERIVEYPYVFSKLSDASCRLLDAGSTFNFPEIITHPVISKKELTIFTAFPETWNFTEKKISYQFGDLRKLPFRDAWYDEIACISTLEHIGMDNAIYGEERKASTSIPGVGESGYLTAIGELIRVLKPKGAIMITVPFGKKINYGYFQQFDESMVDEVLKFLAKHGSTETTYFNYLPTGWQFGDLKSCISAEAYNPHTGEGKGDDGAAHSRAICAIHFRKHE